MTLLVIDSTRHWLSISFLFKEKTLKWKSVIALYRLYHLLVYFVLLSHDLCRLFATLGLFKIFYWIIYLLLGKDISESLVFICRSLFFAWFALYNVVTLVQSTSLNIFLNFLIFLLLQICLVTKMPFLLECV